jgi:hypothetical protein
MSRITVGSLLIALGACHQLLGVLIAVMGPPPIPDGRNLLREVVEAGVVGAIEPDPWRMTLFWFLAFGFLLLALGGLAHHVERQGLLLPRWFGWTLIAIGIAGGLCIPASGFWLVVPMGALVLARQGAFASS